MEMWVGLKGGCVMCVSAGALRGKMHATVLKQMEQKPAVALSRCLVVRCCVWRVVWCFM